MLRIAKPPGFGNIVLEEAPMPIPGARDVVVKNHISLISRGSEILRRYMHEEAIDPAIMGYSVGGVVVESGAEAASRFPPGLRVAATAPHAQYVMQDIDALEGTRVWPLPDDMTFEQAAFAPLCTGAVSWAACSGVQPGDTVVVLGQGLVGNLVLQALHQYNPGLLIAVDALPLRCHAAAQVGAEVVIHTGEEDPVARVHALTGGKGAHVVIDCVGGKAGVSAFAQAQEMLADLGTLHLIGLYHGEPLPLDAGKIQRRRIVGGYYGTPSRPAMMAQAVEMLHTGQFQLEPLITHRIPYRQTPAAFDLLYNSPDAALGVLLIWEESLT
jgi:threonine dehydrogenase-like Zn-dependent dehydrogenase